MSKPEPIRFETDDFAVVVNGETYHPHEGEWVELYPDRSVAEVMSAGSLAKLGAQLQAAKGDTDEARQILAAISEHFDTVCANLADRVVAWSWTNRRGDPLPQPDGTAGPIRRLTNEELNYLLNLAHSEQENEEERKNGLRPSRIGSSATRSRPSRASRSEGRSR